MSRLQASSVLRDTVRFTATHAGLYADAPEVSGPWLVTGAVLMAQQAAALALKQAGDSIPEQAGATELLLRAASKDRLPPPFTLPFGFTARQGFDRLVEARNAFMHPRGVGWFVSAQTLSRGLPVAVAAVRHLILVQPVSPDLCQDRTGLNDALEIIEALADFLL